MPHAEREKDNVKIDEQEIQRLGIDKRVVGLRMLKEIKAQ